MYLPGKFKIPERLEFELTSIDAQASAEIRIIGLVFG